MEEMFNVYRDKWNQQTMLYSDSSKIYSNKYYQAIITMGVIAIPFILKDWQTTDNHWFNALSCITCENPIKPENRGNIKAMKQDWIDFLSSQA